MEKVKKQYGLWTGMAMVVGIVIGSGVFLKAGGVLQLSGGDLRLSTLAWLIGGLIMVASGFCFAVFATKVTKFNGVVDYVEVATGSKRIGYHLAWLITTFYYPIIASIVALFAGSYFFSLIGSNVGLTDRQNFLFAFGVLTIVVVVNYLSPMIAGKFQVSATVIKLIPILLIAVLGLVASLFVDGAGIINAVTTPAEGFAVSFGDAIKKTAFAYEGWVCATAINAELKDSKRDLPRALVGGTIAILVFYIIYYIGLSAFLGNAGTIAQDANAPIAVFNIIFGNIGGKLFTAFIMISCLGTVNGVVMSCCRGMYTMSCRGQGPAPEKFSKLGKNQSVSLLSCIYGYVCSLLMLGVWYLAMHGVWLFPHLGSMDEIVCAIIYAVYITMYIHIMKTYTEYGVFKRFVMPIIAIIGSVFFMLCGTGLYQLITQQDAGSFKAFLVFMGLFVILMAPSFLFYNKDAKGQLEEEN